MGEKDAMNRIHSGHHNLGSKRAKVLLTDSIAIACLVRELTETTALLEFAEPTELPKLFRVLMTSSNFIYPAQLRSQRGLLADVDFTGPGQPSAAAEFIAAGPSRFHSRFPSNAQICDATLRVWNEQGYSGTTLKRISAVAGIGEAAILRRFGTKAGLICSALEREAEEFCRKCTRTDDLIVDLGNLLEVYQTVFRRRGRLLLELLLGMSKGSALHAMAPVLTTALTKSADVITSYQAMGKLRGVSPWEPLIALLAPLFVASLQENRKQLEITSTDRLDRFLQGWAGTPSGEDGSS